MFDASIVGKDLNSFVTIVTNIDATIRTKSYTIRITKLAMQH